MNDGSSGGRGAVQMEPVVKLWEQLFEALADFDHTPESDEAAHDAAEERYHEARKRFMTTPPATSLGVALKHKFLAHVKGHEQEDLDTPLLEVRIVRDLVRQLTSEPDWICPIYRARS